MIIGSYSTNSTILTPKMYKYLVKGDLSLLRGNFLSEYKTLSDKNKVLKNLGIDKIVKPTWGSITGNIEDLKDLMNKLENSSIKTADKVLYTNLDYSELENVKQALDKLLYKDLSISILATPNSAEKGDSIDKVTFTWSYNKSNIKELLFDSLPIESTLRTYTINGPITTNISKTITGNDGSLKVSATASLIFYYGIYSCNSIELPSISQCKRTLTNSLNGTYIVNAKDNEYIWFLIPKELGTPTFTVGVFSGGFYKYSETTYKKIDYNIYRSDNHSLGNTTIKLS